MSTFDGRIKEYPAIAIDNFSHNSVAKYFLLSHVHSDHMRGLEDCRFNRPIYCTEQTARIVPFISVKHNKAPKYRHLKDLLIPVPYNKPIRIDTVEYGTIEFRFLNANHCIGSSSILVKGKNGTILYTGDIRAEPNIVKENYKEATRTTIQNLYMDTTCVREEQETFISKRKSIDLLLSLIKNQEENHHIYIDCWTFGYEEAWAAIADTFDQKIHVSRLKYETYVAGDPIYADYLTTDPEGTRFHSCDWESECEKNEHGLIAVHFKPTRDDQPRIFTFAKESNFLLKSDLKFECKPQTRYILPFSFHSSFEEVMQFMKFIKPHVITPCVARNGYEGMERMRKLMIERGYRLGEGSDSFTSTSSFSSKRKGTFSSASSSFKKVHSETLSDPETFSTGGSGSTWGLRTKSMSSRTLTSVAKSNTLPTINEQRDPAVASSSSSSKRIPLDQPQASPPSSALALPPPPPSSGSPKVSLLSCSTSPSLQTNSTASLIVIDSVEDTSKPFLITETNNVFFKQLKHMYRRKQNKSQ